MYNKKKIKIFIMNMTYFIKWSEKYIYISFVVSLLMNFFFSHFTGWNKSHILDKKKLNILSVFLKEQNSHPLCCMTLSEMAAENIQGLFNFASMHTVMYWDRQVWVNNVDLDQTGPSSLISVYTVYHSFSMLLEAILMSTHNICFYGEISKIVP